jgi:hypothetical protein
MNVNSAKGGDLDLRAVVAPCTDHHGSPFGAWESYGSV